jgi:hypothetical protein
MTKNTLGYQVIEDNAGNLFLAVFDGDECIYLASGFEYDPENLQATIEALRNGGHPIQDCWESDFPDDYIPQQLYDELFGDEYGWEIIADEVGIYPERMGAAGRIAFGLNTENLDLV